MVYKHACILSYVHTCKPLIIVILFAQDLSLWVLHAARTCMNLLENLLIPHSNIANYSNSSYVQL